MQKFLAWLEGSFKYFVAAILIIIPLYPKFPLIRVPGIYVSIRFEDFLMLALALITLIKLLPKLRQLMSNGIIRAFLIFFLVGLTSLISGVFLTRTTNLGINLLHLFRRVEYFVPFLAVFAFFEQERSKNIEFYVKTLMLTVFIVFLYGIGQRYFNFPVIITQNEEYSKGVALRWIPGSHINSTFAGHYDLATFLVLVMPIFISLLFILKDKVTRLVLFGVSLSAIWLLINSVSRISLISYLIGVSISLLLIRKYKEIILVVFVSLILSALSPALFARYSRVVEVLLKLSNVNTSVLAADTLELPTPTPIPVFEDRSTSIRFNVEWPRAIRALTKNPLLGTGYSSISLATDNDYLRALGEIGILGFAAFMLLFVRIAKTFSKIVSKVETFPDLERGFVIGIVGGFAGALTNALFIDIFEASKFAIIFWLLIAFAVFLMKERLNEQNI